MVNAGSDTPHRERLRRATAVTQKATRSQDAPQIRSMPCRSEKCSEYVREVKDCQEATGPGGAASTDTSPGVGARVLQVEVVGVVPRRRRRPYGDGGVVRAVGRRMAQGLARQDELSAALRVNRATLYRQQRKLQMHGRHGVGSSVGELAITRRISPVAVCCSRASESSRLRVYRSSAWPPAAPAPHSGRS